MPTDNIHNLTAKYSFSLSRNSYNSITNPFSPYRSWLPPSNIWYNIEIPNGFCFNFSSFKKKTKKEILEIE
jgi:hypothetical protein